MFCLIRKDVSLGKGNRMIRRAFVIENDKNRSHVLVYRSEACGSCNACNACNAKPTSEWVENSLGAKPGDVVQIEFTSKKFYQSIFKLYILPLLFFLVGMFAFYFYEKARGSVNELHMLLGGLFGLLLSFFYARYSDHTSADDLLKMVDIESLEAINASSKMDPELIDPRRM